MLRAIGRVKCGRCGFLYAVRETGLPRTDAMMHGEFDGARAGATRSLEAWIRDAAREREQAPNVRFVLRCARALLGALRAGYGREVCDERAQAEACAAVGVAPSSVSIGAVDDDASELMVTLARDPAATAPALGYVSPGHFSLPTTPLSDVHGALVLAYEMLTLELPWDAGSTPWSHERLGELEASMRKGPRGVRALRGAIDGETARALDGFFSREFSALHKLADAGARACAEGQGARWQHAVYSLDLAGRSASRVAQLEAMLARRASETEVFALVRSAAKSAPREAKHDEAASAVTAAREEPFVLGAGDDGAVPREVAVTLGAGSALVSRGFEDVPCTVDEQARVRRGHEVSSIPPPAELSREDVARRDGGRRAERSLVVPAMLACVSVGVATTLLATLPEERAFLADRARAQVARVSLRETAARVRAGVLARVRGDRAGVVAHVATRPASERTPEASARAASSPAPIAQSEPTVREAPLPSAAVAPAANAPASVPAAGARLECTAPYAGTRVELRGTDGHIDAVLCVTARASLSQPTRVDRWDSSRDEALRTAWREGRLRCATDETVAPLRVSLEALGREAPGEPPAGWALRCRPRVGAAVTVASPLAAGVTARARR